MQDIYDGYDKLEVSRSGYFGDYDEFNILYWYFTGIDWNIFIVDKPLGILFLVVAWFFWVKVYSHP